LQFIRKLFTATAGAACALVAVTSAGSLLTSVSPARADSGKLALTSLRWTQSRVDASGGNAVVNLDWTVRDSNTAATAISGDVKVRLAGPQAGTFVGQALDIPFSLTGGITGLTPSGTAQNSRYSYSFTVPQYSFSSTAQWTVIQVITRDDQGQRLNIAGNDLNRYSGVLTATELVDSTAPTYDSLGFSPVIDPSRPFIFDGDGGGSSSYFFNADDAQSGFWKGVITLTGPGGKILASSFQEVFSVANGFGMCGAGIVFDDTSAGCQPSVTIPAGIPAGTWTVSKLALWDNAGNHVTYANLHVLPITVTSDSSIRASAFSANPTQVDNWVNDATVRVSMNVTGAVGGVSAIYVDFTAGPCRQRFASPTQNPDGSYSVDISMFSFADSCSVTGIAVLDGAGDVSVYGPEYGLPDLGINLTRVPDTTPPVATGAQVSPASQPTNPNSTGFEDLTVDVNDAIAPVNDISTTVFNSSGQIVGGGFGGVIATLTGPVTTSIPLPVGLPPGTYTVAFQLTDAGGLTSSYGYPNSPPVPGGPLVFTVTPQG
jgi:hypothetical protein